MIGRQFLLTRFIDGHLRALIDPRAEHADLVGRKALAFAVGRHQKIFVDAGDEANQLTLAALAGNERRFAVIAAGGQRLMAIDAKIALLLLLAVASDAVLLEDRLDIAREVDLPVGRRR